MGMGLGPGELILLFLLVLLLFGAKRLPEIGSSLGKGIREFKTSFREIEQDLKVPSDHHLPQTTTPTGEEQTSSDEDGEPRTLSDSVPSGQQ